MSRHIPRTLGPEPRVPGRLSRPLPALALGLSLLGAGPALGQARSEDGASAKPAVCPTRSYRWQEDCSNLAGRELTGLDAWRYRPLTADGDVWLTVGGEARTRMDLLHDVDFGIAGAPGYTEFAYRLMGHADLRSRAGARAFVQLAVTQQDGRYKPRPHDDNAPDITQVFVDVPVTLGGRKLTVRAGRQELDLSGNRLIASRDGVSIRRAFEGAKLDLDLGGGARLAALSVRPMDLEHPAFRDRADPTERFNAVVLDLPRAWSPGGAASLYYFDRDRGDAHWLRAEGDERRYSIGARYLGHVGEWRVESQATFQTGHAAGKPVRAYGASLSLDQEFGPDRPVILGFDLVTASGDKARTRRIETFDPMYPNNFGLSDAPLFYQTNYVFAGGSVSTRWAGATWTAGSNLLFRNSTTDAVYASGRAIPNTLGGQTLTSLLSQVSVRRPFGRRYEAYASLVRADALGVLRAGGGGNALYSRVQLTARF